MMRSWSFVDLPCRTCSTLAASCRSACGRAGISCLRSLHLLGSGGARRCCELPAETHRRAAVVESARAVAQQRVVVELHPRRITLAYDHHRHAFVGAVLRTKRSRAAAPQRVGSWDFSPQEGALPRWSVCAAAAAAWRSVLLPRARHSTAGVLRVLSPPIVIGAIVTVKYSPLSWSTLLTGGPFVCEATNEQAVVLSVADPPCVCAELMRSEAEGGIHRGWRDPYERICRRIVCASRSSILQRFSKTGVPTTTDEELGFHRASLAAAPPPRHRS